MTYQYIIGESIVRIDKKVLKYFLFCSEIGVTPMCPAGFPNRTNIAYEHLWDRDYSGKLFYSELIEAWYRNTTFSFVECRLVPYFLNDPRFGYGVPPREWVRKIKIIRITTTESVLSIYRGEEKAYNIKTGDLDNLKDLPKLTRVIFDFDAAFTSLPTYHDNYRRFVLTDLREMFSNIQDLLDRECRVSVMFSNMAPLEMRRDELTSRIWEDKLETIRPD